MSMLKLYAPIPSSLHDSNVGVPHTPRPYDFDQLKWDFEISVDEGFKRIERKMYPFKEACDQNGLLIIIV